MPGIRSLLPFGHFMSLAPLDVWVRMLWSARFAVAPQYWPRVAFALFTSALSTVLTLPERLLLAPFLWTRFRGGAPTLVPAHPPLLVLGYSRSGTTHLHNLLATHPDVVTPRWVQAMCPQGFWLSWAFLRWALVPFLPNTRPQDDVGFGPDWPAEDDFAHCNWADASCLAGRMVFPLMRGPWLRYQTLEGLSPRELSRWRRVVAAVAWKVQAAHPGRVLLLKSPGHTAKVRELDRIFGGKARYVHITRSAADVLRSNVAMHTCFGAQSLRPLPPESQSREHVIREYAETEHRFLADAESLALSDEGRLVRMHFDDLAKHPMAQFERVCTALGLRWDEAVRGRAKRYLEAVGDYKPRHRGTVEQLDPRLRDLDEALAVGLPRSDPADAPESHAAPQGASGRRRMGAVVAGCVAGTIGFGLWMALAFLLDRRLDFMSWPIGGLVGAVTLRAAGGGDWRLGAWAAVISLAVTLASVWPLPEIAFGWTGPDRFRNLQDAYGSLNNNYLWPLFGILSAARYASRRFMRPPGFG